MSDHDRWMRTPDERERDRQEAIEAAGGTPVKDCEACPVTDEICDECFNTRFVPDPEALTNDDLARKLKRLGSKQEMALRALCEHGYYPGAWTMGGHLTTIRLLNTLVRHGLVYAIDTPYSPPYRCKGIATSRPVYHALGIVLDLYRWERKIKNDERDRKRAAEVEEMERKAHEECTRYKRIRDAVVNQRIELAKLRENDDREPVEVFGREAMACLFAAEDCLIRLIDGCHQENKQ